MTERLALRFERVAAERRAALLTFIMAGDPDAETSSAILAALPAAGADIVELGMPFSDPIADGPSLIQARRPSARYRPARRCTRPWRWRDNSAPEIRTRRSS